MQRPRPLGLGVLVLWLLMLATISTWRGVELWRQGALIHELGSTLSPPVLALFVAFYIGCGTAMAASALGLWWRRVWAVRSARLLIPLYVGVGQAYTWLFVRSGLMWERRWGSLVLGLGAAVIAVGVTTWRRSRRWLGLPESLSRAH